jgi:SSS family solute:Na+ symporter
MATLDWIVLGIFFGLLIGIVWWVLRQKEETSVDYFLAGRNAGWFVIGASIFASNIGSEHLVGLAGSGADSGMAMAHWEMHAWIILILGWIFVPFYARSRVYTMPEFLEKRYNAASRTVLSLISLVSYVLTKVAVTVWAGGTVFQTVFGIEYIEVFGSQIDFFWVGAIGLVVITGLYTVFGGMKSVLYTSALQTPVLLIGSIFILVIGLNQLGGWSELESIIKAQPTGQGDDMMDLIRSPQDPQFPWTGVVLGSIIIGIWYWCTDQYIVQRTLSAANLSQARKGTIFAGYLKLLPVFIFLVPGMIAFAMDQQGMLNLENSDDAFPLLVAELLPVGVKGLVVGGLTAALMSSLGSLFNSSATLFTVDFYKKFRPETPEKKLVIIGKIATAVIVVLGILWIPIMESIGDFLYAYIQDIQSLIAPGIATIFLFGIFWKRTTPKAGFWTLLIGFFLGMFRLVFRVITNVFIVPAKAQANSIEWINQAAANPQGLNWFETFSVKFMAMNWLHYEILLFFFCVLLIVIISLNTEKPSKEKLKGLTFAYVTKEQKAETRASITKWDIINTVIIAAIIIAFYAYFW